MNTTIGKHIFICTKEEAYTFDEISFIIEGIKSPAQINKLKMLLSAVNENKNKKAVFFMPEQSFNIFAMLQGDNSICEISTVDIEIILKEFENCKNDSILKNSSFSTELVRKLKILLNFMNSGNSVKPVSIQADNLSEIDII